MNAKLVARLAFTASLLAAPPCLAQQHLVSPTPGNPDVFGTAVAMEGGLAVIGSHNDDVPDANDAGSVFIYVRRNSVWELSAQLFSPSPRTGAQFGRAVAISGDLIAVSEPRRHVGTAFNCGAVHIYRRHSAAWLHEFTITPAAPQFDADFGGKIAMHADTVAVAASGEDSQFLEDVGYAYIFRRQGNTWTQSFRYSDPNAPEYGLFPDALDLQGNTAVFTSNTNFIPSGVQAGQALVFNRDAQGVWSLLTRLSPADGRQADKFGDAVALSGNRLAVGAGDADIGTVQNAGAVYIFSRNATSWTQSAKLTHESPSTSDRFGTALAADADLLAVGSQHDDTPRGTDSGSVALFTYTGINWTRGPLLTAPDGAANDFFGGSVTASQGQLVVGAYSDDLGSIFNAGSAWAFFTAFRVPQREMVPASTPIMDLRR